MSLAAAYTVPHPPLIIPAVGRGQQRIISDTVNAYRKVAQRIAAHAPDTIVVISPHAPLFRDCFYLSTGSTAHGDMGRFGARRVAINASYDTAFAAKIALYAHARGIPLCENEAGDAELDHATFVPLWFVNEVYEKYRLVRIGLSGLSPRMHRALGCCIAEAVQDLNQNVVLLASGDLSHKLKEDGPYGYANEGPLFDRKITALLDSGNLEELFSLDDALVEAAAECGLRSFQIMAGALDNLSFTHELLSYEGPFGVGYAVAAFEVMSKTNKKPADNSATETKADPYVTLARASVEGFVRTGHLIARPAELPQALTDERAGVFVSLHKDEELRGCIGTIEATGDSIADEIIRNAMWAASRDPRFSPVKENELDFLSYSVDVLFPSESIQSPAELDPARYGVIVTKGCKCGLLLPNLEGVETVEQQLSIAKRKAGIDPYDNEVKLERFEVVRHTCGGEARRE